MMPPMPERLPLLIWLREGLRTGVLLRPRVGPAQPAPWQLLAIVLLTSLLDIGLGWFEIGGDAQFDLRGWLAPWWNTGAMLLVAWCLLPAQQQDPQRPRGLAAWIALWLLAMVPAATVSQFISIAQAQDWLPDAIDSGAVAWTLYALLWLWLLAALVRLSIAFGLAPARNAALALGLAALFAIGAVEFPDRPWQDNTPVADEGGPVLTQEIFETQQAIWQQSVANLAPQRPGVVDVYGIVFAPYAGEDVFLRESTMVKEVLEDRFDAVGRVLQLVNHPTTADQLPWATPLNLERAITAMGEKMDREHDVLFIYLTSHAASDFKLDASNPPLDVDAVSPGELRQALDNAGIVNRVIVVSACYSGGWLGPIADEHTLVMTAADATHTSFGCGSRSKLTFFGRAVFDEQLRRTHSLEDAFKAAVPVIRHREEEAGKDDGFSNPQMLVGDKIRPVLQALQARLDNKLSEESARRR
jgi:hypothetical protein